MNKKVVRFGVWLIILVSIWLVGNIWLSCIVEKREYLHVILSYMFLLYSFTPLFAVLLTQKPNLINFKYRLFFKTLPYKSLFKIISIIAISYPLIILGLTFLFGNILNVDLVGSISVDTSRFSGILLSQSPLFRFFILFIVILLGGLLTGMTLHFLVVLGGEIAWRGLLEREIRIGNRAKKTVIIGLIWGIWGIIPTVFSRSLAPFDTAVFIEIALMFGFYIVCSFLCVSILYKTGTIIGVALARGLINSFSLFILMVITPSFSYSVTNNRHLFSIIAVILIYILINYQHRKHPFIPKENSIPPGNEGAT